MYPFLAEISHPIQCFLISEEVPSISITLKERRSNALKGSISSKSNLKGNFYTHRPIKDKPTSWSFEKGVTKLNGEAILLKDCLLYTSPSPRDRISSRMPSSA